MPSRLKPRGAPQTPFLTTDPAAAFEHFRKEARAIPEADIKVCTTDVEVARYNADIGLRAVAPHLDLIRDKLPRCPIEAAMESGSVALGLIFAVDRATPAAADVELQTRLDKLRPMRELALQQLEILASLGLVPKERVSAVRAGVGLLDTARDAVVIPALYREYQGALAGKHPFAPSYLEELSAHGQWLLPRVKPMSAVEKRAPRSDSLIERDRFWTLLVQRYDHVREAGVVVFGLRDLDANVPPLGARIASSPAAVPIAAEPQAPAVPPAPA